MKKMKKTIVIIAALLLCVPTSAQKAEPIKSIITKCHEPEWYGQQAELWQKLVDENPKDQSAWGNLFRASYYKQQLGGGWDANQDESETADIIRKMQEEMPDSYVLNLSKCRFCLTTDSAAMRGDCIYRAIELMPEDASAEDVDYLACRLWSIDPENRLVGELFTKAYEKRWFPSRIMAYNRNMLLSMQPDALYFANGDVLLAPMKMLQEALDERRDVTIIPISYFHSASFMEALCKRLGIKPLTIDVQDYGKYGDDWYKHYEADIIMYLIKACKRPTYFSTDILSHTKLDKDSIYNEGLLLKYSPRQYDNFDVAMRNVRDVYSLEYLAQPDLVYDSWVTSQQLDLNNVTLLANLVPKLRRNGDTAQADRLHKILGKCVERCPLLEHPEAKEAIAKKFKEETEKQ